VDRRVNNIKYAEIKDAYPVMLYRLKLELHYCDLLWICCRACYEKSPQQIRTGRIRALASIAGQLVSCIATEVESAF